MSTRALVHAASSSPHGASAPRQEGPADLRLLPPALSAWAAAALALTAPPWAVTTTCIAAALLALALLAGAGPRLPARTAAASALLCAAAAAAVAALHGADLHRGPVPRLAAAYGHASVELEVTGDPRPTRPYVRGAARTREGVMLEAEVRRIGAVATRTPVLLIAQPAQGKAAWLALLPSTRIRVQARFAPPLHAGDRIAAALRVQGKGPPTVLRGPSASQRAAGSLRQGLRDATEGLSPDARALLPGLVIGDTSRIPVELDEAFRATDLTHLLAVSGANLTIVLIVLIGPAHLASQAERRGLAARLGIPLRLTAVLGGALTLAFVVVCRPEPSVLRAAACGLITLLAIGTGRRRSLLPALAGAVLLLVLFDPWLARDYGFLLSVLATGALLTLAPRWSAAMRARGIPPRLAEGLAAACAAQAVCAPVVVVLAARVSLVAIPCNLLAELAVAPATVLGFAALATAPAALPLAKALAWPAGWPAEWIAGIARTGAALPGAELRWPGGWLGAALLAALTLLALRTWRRLLRTGWAAPIAAVAALLLLITVTRPPPVARLITGWPPAGWRMAVCDVGQGDALVLAAGEGTALVVDAGPEPKLVDRCLRTLGVRRIPLLLLTHFHADHVAGLPGVLRGRAVGAIETTTLEEPPGQAEFVRRTAVAKGVPLIHAVAGERRSIGELSWQVLWPEPQVAGARSSAAEGANDASVTLLVRMAGLTALLLGDLEPPAQQGLLSATPGLPPVDILKVAHHGSAYQDPALLARAAPRLALISCGADNPYGHPAPSTIAALRAQGASVLRTDTEGPIAVSGRGRSELRASVSRSGL